MGVVQPCVVGPAQIEHVQKVIDHWRGGSAVGDLVLLADEGEANGFRWLRFLGHCLFPENKRKEYLVVQFNKRIPNQHLTTVPVDSCREQAYIAFAQRKREKRWPHVLLSSLVFILYWASAACWEVLASILNPQPILHINIDDVSVTRMMVEAGKLIDILVQDHLVLGRNRFVSLRERGLGFS